jgi:hypothetical protein
VLYQLRHDVHVTSRSPMRLRRVQVRLRGRCFNTLRQRALEASLSVKLLICLWTAHPPQRGWLTSVDWLVQWIRQQVSIVTWALHRRDSFSNNTTA